MAKEGMKKSLAQMIRDREVDSEQAELRKTFLASHSALYLAIDKIFGPLKIDKVTRVDLP